MSDVRLEDSEYRRTKQGEHRRCPHSCWTPSGCTICNPPIIPDALPEQDQVAPPSEGMRRAVAHGIGARLRQDNER